jgi:hypothetical protein
VARANISEEVRLFAKEKSKDILDIFERKRGCGLDGVDIWPPS